MEAHDAAPARGPGRRADEPRPQTSTSFVARFTSGGVASSRKAASASFTVIVVCACDPRRRTETVFSSASRRPTARMIGTLASECSRTL